MKPRVLIVDDDEVIARQLRWILHDDYDVVIANDMKTAVRHATIHEPAISIVDLHLPPAVESPHVGLRVMEYIKGHLPSSKVLVITGAAGIQTRAASYAGGADEFLVKPFEPEVLLATVRRMALQRLELV
ncbi:MAG TPA: response regulator [Pyrinomonadaceae bacterium]|nr:response regulator [Pyrinomonadaceae bacterium]